MRKGSFTVEAAFLMPLVCTVLVLIVYLCAHVHNRALLLSRAYEEAIMETKLEETKLFGMGNMKRTETFGEQKNEVTYETETKAAWGGWNWPLKVTGSHEKINPVEFIRKCQIGKLIAGEIKGS